MWAEVNVSAYTDVCVSVFFREKTEGGKNRENYEIGQVHMYVLAFVALELSLATIPSYTPVFQSTRGIDTRAHSNESLCSNIYSSE